MQGRCAFDCTWMLPPPETFFYTSVLTGNLNWDIKEVTSQEDPVEEAHPPPWMEPKPPRMEGLKDGTGGGVPSRGHRGGRPQTALLTSVALLTEVARHQNKICSPPPLILWYERRKNILIPLRLTILMVGSRVHSDRSFLGLRKRDLNKTQDVGDLLIFYCLSVK